MGVPKRIAFVCPRFAEGGTVGGAETLLKNLALRLARAGLDIAFLTTCARSHFTWKNEIPPGVRRIEGLEVHFFPVDETRDEARFLNLQHRISRGEALSRDEEETWAAHSVNSAALCAHLRAEAPRFDRIVMGPYLFGLVYRAARVAPERTLLAPCLHDEPFAYLALTRELFAAVRGCLFNSEPEQELAERIGACARARGRVVGMGLEPFEADPRAFAARRGLAQPYVMYAGRREAGKGTPLLTAYLDAFRLRTGRDVKLVLTGSGPIEAPPSLGPHLIDCGFVSEEEKRAALAGAVAFVHPSTLESLGIVLLEAFLARTPALVHAGSAVLRWQCRRSGGGLWFRNYAEFEEELLRLLDDPPLRQALGAAGRSYVLREYDWTVVLGRLKAALAEL